MYDKSNVIKDERSFLSQRLLAAWILFSTLRSMEQVSDDAEAVAQGKTGITGEKSKILEIREKKIHE